MKVFGQYYIGDNLLVQNVPQLTGGYFCFKKIYIKNYNYLLFKKILCAIFTHKLPNFYAFLGTKTKKN